nr:isochorismatase family protein [Paenibacillus sp. 79R4]
MGSRGKGSALTSEEFADFISKNKIGEFFIAGADAVACVKSTCFNMRKANYGVNVLSDCITSYV